MENALLGWESILRALQQSKTQQQRNIRSTSGGPSNSTQNVRLTDLLPTSLEKDSNISYVLTAAAEAEAMGFQEVAQILMDYAYSLAQNLDPLSEGRGVVQFKTSLNALIRGRTATQKSPTEKVRAIELFFKNYQEHIRTLQEDEENNREALGKAWKTAKVLEEALAWISRRNDVRVDEKVTQDIKDAAANTNDFVKQKYNIVPIGINDVWEPVSSISEVLGVLKFQERLQIPLGGRSGKETMEYLKEVFGFQPDNVANQREHIVLLLASDWIRHKGHMANETEALQTALRELFDKVLANFMKWGAFVKADINFIRDARSDQELMTYLSLYLLIWGEAGNIRFMPECLSFIFYGAAKEVHEFISSGQLKRSVAVRESSDLTESQIHGSFLENVVVPVYKVISQEALYAGEHSDMKGHEKWRNYDDLNEFFWSERCLALGWPLNQSHGFFTPPPAEKHREEEAPLIQASQQPVTAKRNKRLSKTLFVEWRNFWHLFHSFDRLWIFLIAMFQALTLIAFSGADQWSTLQKVLTVFPTIAILQTLQASTDIMMCFGSYRSMHPVVIWRKVLRLVAAGALATALVFFCIKMLQEMGKSSRPYLGVYVVLLLAYVAPRILINLLLRFAALRKLVDKVDEKSFVRFLKWLYQEEFFVGRGMYESTYSVTLYSLFWFVVLVSKFLFGYYLLIHPLVSPTSYIIDFVNIQYKWHDFVSGANHNALTLASLWVPVFTIYLLDIQIWYTVASALLGGMMGAYSHLGEIRSLTMLRARFGSFPTSFVSSLLTPDSGSPGNETPYSNSLSSDTTPAQMADRKNATRFALAWNEIIQTMRDEDYVSNRELDLLRFPASTNKDKVQWPIFLLANQVYLAAGYAASNTKSDTELWKKVCENVYMSAAVLEVYETLIPFLQNISRGRTASFTPEQWTWGLISEEIDNSIREGRFANTFKLSAISELHDKIASLTALLVQEENPVRHSKAATILEELFALVKRSFLQGNFLEKMELQLYDFQLKGGRDLFKSVSWPSDADQALRFHLLLTMKDSAEEVPHNLEARRRLQYFCNSLFMKMPDAPTVKAMLPFCVMTPYFSEIVAYSLEELHQKNEDGISTLFYLQKIYPDEWTNFLERIGLTEQELFTRMKAGNDMTELRMWVSYRGQTLARTVRGMMYYRRALQLLAFMEAPESETMADLERGNQENIERDFFLNDETRGLADLKFTYVVTCQIYGKQKESKDARYYDIYDMMKRHPGLRVAYIDEKEVRGPEGKSWKEYYSCLLRVDKNGEEQEIYRIKLPGPAKLGEGKPENQNHAIVFTRGHALQTIDMNQDNYFEEALKMRNLLQEFKVNKEFRDPTILGVREHVFTGSVSSLASFMSNQESSFVTLGQRVLAQPLKVRMHYGHPDVFDRLFHITRGGISKSSKLIHISEDIFAGFNTTLRQGNITHHEYIQVGKGRDVGLNQIALFEAKVASGNGEQTLSRDVYRLGQQFDFFRMMSFYYTSVGFYLSTMLTVWCVYFFLYGKVYLALSGVEATLKTRADVIGNAALQAALSSQFLLQIGVFTAVPMIVVFIVERGFAEAFMSFILMQLQLASVFFTFSLGTRTHYFGRTILHGGAKYRSTGRGFVVKHEKFAELYRFFSRSHFTKGLEVGMLLIVYLVYGSSSSTWAYVLLSISSWFLTISWCYGPFIFNPSGFEWQKIVEDFEDWHKWLFYKGGVGIKGNLSWEAWWDEEQAHIKTIRSRFWEVVLSLRFFIFQYGIVYSLNISGGSTSIMVYAYSWAVAGAIVLLLWIANSGKTWDAQLQVRTLQTGLLTGCITILVLLVSLTSLTVGDVFASILVFIPTGWGLLEILVAIQPVLPPFLRKSVKAFARFYDALMGALIFIPVAILSWFPFISTFQSRLMFNQAFSRGLEISLILSGKKDEDKE